MCSPKNTCIWLSFPPALSSYLYLRITKSQIRFSRPQRPPKNGGSHSRRAKNGEKENRINRLSSAPPPPRNQQVTQTLYSIYTYTSRAFYKRVKFQNCINIKSLELGHILSFVYTFFILFFLPCFCYRFSIAWRDCHRGVL